MGFPKIIFFLILIFIELGYTQSLVLNEIMSSNTNSFMDEFGEYPDWIEIYNSGPDLINLSNFSLSDNKNNLRKWIFPAINIDSKNYLLINASGREISNQAASWETIFTKGNNCKYFLGISEPPGNWNENIFNDNNWELGNTGIGYGDSDDLTPISPVSSIYIRKEFNIEDIDEIAQVMYNIDYDDGFVAYINGNEIARANLGNYGEFTPFNKSADEAEEAKLYLNEKLESFMLNSISDHLVNGSNVLAIQVHNYGTSSSDLTAIPFLTLGYYQQISNNFIAEEIEDNIPKIHANFKISNGAETIYLSDNLGNLIDSVQLPTLEPNTSFGRKPDGGIEWNIFSEATPNSSNSAIGYSGNTNPPKLNFAAGFYNSNVVLRIANSEQGVSTYYTSDGSEPTTSSILFEESVTLTKTTVLKLRSFSENFLPSTTKAFTYFINVDKDLPIISLSTDPKNLWDYNNGIYVLGPNAENELPFFGANFWEDWTRSANFEFFDPTENIYIETLADIKIFGAYSRAHAQKSISVFSTGGNKLKNVFFPNEDIDEVNSIVLRNSGNDWQYTMFRDGFLQDVANPLNLDQLAFRPAILYLNGEYWGIHNIREKINLNYIADHHDVKKDDIDLLELFGKVIDGDNSSYFELINFMETNDLSSNSNYDIVSAQIDIDNFIDYNLFEIFIGNTDWPGNNNKYWKSKSDNSKWRWILFDTDFGFGIYNPSDYSHNTLRFALEENGPKEWPNPPWSTFIIRKLLENENFKNNFVTRYSDLTNSVFLPGNVKSKISKAKSVIENEINDHAERWDQFSYSTWERNVNQMNNFADMRLTYLDQYFQNEFDLDDKSSIILEHPDFQSGLIKINTITIDKEVWKGNYFTGINIKLQAIPNPGYKFVEWSGSLSSTEEVLEVDFNSVLNIKARFEYIEEFENIVINEINYNSYASFDTGDWVELYNNSDENVDLTNWQFTDEIDTNNFTIPNNAILSPREYLIITRDSVDFISQYGNDFNIIGNFDFGLSNSGELIKLLDANSNIIDSLRYDDKFPWPQSADGTGNTLELYNPAFNNANYINWGNSSNFGSPGKRNSNFSITSVDRNEQLPKKISLAQNYPNPFNPSTVIEYSVPASSGNVHHEVSLIVFDILGRELETLVDSKQTAGNYKAVFNGSKLSSGVYFYKLSVDNNVMINKMALIK